MNEVWCPVLSYHQTDHTWLILLSSHDRWSPTKCYFVTQRLRERQASQLKRKKEKSMITTLVLSVQKCGDIVQFPVYIWRHTKYKLYATPNILFCKSSLAWAQLQYCNKSNLYTSKQWFWMALDFGAHIMLYVTPSILVLILQCNEANSHTVHSPASTHAVRIHTSLQSSYCNLVTVTPALILWRIHTRPPQSYCNTVKSSICNRHTSPHTANLSLYWPDFPALAIFLLQIFRTGNKQ